MKACKHDWSIFDRININGVEASHRCSLCGRHGRAVRRYNRKTGRDEWQMRMISR